MRKMCVLAWGNGEENNNNKNTISSAVRLEKRTVENIKMRLWAFSPQRDQINRFLPRLSLRYITIPHAERFKSSAELMAREIKALLAKSYTFNEKIENLHQNKRTV